MSDATTTTGDVEDRLAILDIEGEYAMRCDAGDGEGWAQLFTEDGVYQWPPIAGMPEPPPPLRAGQPSPQDVRPCRERACTECRRPR